MFLVVGFAPTAYTLTEGLSPYVTLTVVRIEKLNLIVNVTLVTLQGTTDGRCKELKLKDVIYPIFTITTETDYIPTNVAVIFGPGESSRAVQVTVTDDDILEDDEVFYATLISNEHNIIVNDDRGNVSITISDNDHKFDEPVKQFVFTYLTLACRGSKG